MFWLFRKPKWFVQVSLCEVKGGRYPNAPKSRGHRGDSINNNFVHTIFKQYNAPSLTQIEENVKSIYPDAHNIKLEKIERIQ